MVAGSKGAKIPQGNKQQIMAYPAYVPLGKELAELNNIAKPILKQIQLNREVNKSLVELRDTLFLKLMV